MPLTAIDPRTALIVVDLQQGIVGMPAAHPIAQIVKRARQLADAFRRHALPVVMVNVAGAPPGRTERGFRGELPEGFAEFVPEMMPQPGDHTVTKRTAGAFTRTDLETYLKASGTTQVVIAGVSTSMGVEATARQAHELGFHVTLAVDAMTDLNAALHDIVVTKVFPRISETGTTAEIIEQISRRPVTPPWLDRAPRP